MQDDILIFELILHVLVFILHLNGLGINRHYEEGSIDVRATFVWVFYAYTPKMSKLEISGPQSRLSTGTGLASVESTQGKVD